jgi:hypothetical protein
MQMESLSDRGAALRSRIGRRHLTDLVNELYGSRIVYTHYRSRFAAHRTLELYVRVSNPKKRIHRIRLFRVGRHYAHGPHGNAYGTAQKCLLWATMSFCEVITNIGGLISRFSNIPEMASTKKDALACCQRIVCYWEKIYRDTRPLSIRPVEDEIQVISFNFD